MNSELKTYLIEMIESKIQDIENHLSIFYDEDLIDVNADSTKFTRQQLKKEIDKHKSKLIEVNDLPLDSNFLSQDEEF